MLTWSVREPARSRRFCLFLSPRFWELTLSCLSLCHFDPAWPWPILLTWNRRREAAIEGESLGQKTVAST